MAAITIEQFEEAIHVADVPEVCPYLPDRVATLRYANGFAAGPGYRLLLDRGYRRSGGYVYRPVCHTCRECKVLRVPVAGFHRSKEQRRIWNRGQRVFEAAIYPPSFSEEKRAMYSRYLDFQHHRNEAPADEEQYCAFLVETCLGGRTVELQLRAEGRLAGVGILDRLGDALSTVYFYFDPDFAAYSPGTYSALYEIDLARRWGMDYYYLGYYIRDCPAMAYKAHYRPCEIKDLNAECWTRQER
jgi:arginine-tRNA-protein transferase